MIARIFFLFLFLEILFSSFPLGTFGQNLFAEKGAIPCPQELRITGIKIQFCARGDGPPILFLHGLGGSWEDWAANFFPLSSAYQVTAIDFPGFGESDKPEVEYSIDWLTEIVEKFLQERKITRVNIVGHSMGGLVALNLAARPNSPVKTLVVTDVVGVGDKAGFLSYVLTKKIMGPDSRWESVEEALRGEFKSMMEGFLKGKNHRTSREFFASLPFLRMTPAVQMAASIIDFDIRSKLASVRQPALVLWGTRDPVAPPEEALILKRQLANAALIMFPGAGHSPMQEQPSRFNQVLARFFRQQNWVPPGSQRGAEASP